MNAFRRGTSQVLSRLVTRIFTTSAQVEAAAPAAAASKPALNKTFDIYRYEPVPRGVLAQAFCQKSRGISSICAFVHQVGSR